MPPLLTLLPFQHLVRQVAPHGELLRAWPLSGGVSAQVTALEVRGEGGQVETWVVRHYGEADFRHNPAVAETEFRLLQTLHAAGLPVPAPRWVVPPGELFPRSALVTAYAAGQTDFAPADRAGYAVQLADFLARLHAVRREGTDLSFLPPLRGLGERPAVPDESLDETLIRDVLEPLWPPAPVNPPAVLHGDFWPGNVLWREGRLAAVLDWEDAALGNPLADVGNARLELLFFLGPEAMEAFTRRYRELAALDFAALPLWDLCAALRPAGRLAGWGLDADAEQGLRARHHGFVRQALREVGA
ncbi:hypothetical protein Dcar01_00712 [Deinococcus carri]|uniref:Aminoglycoside phosphotransferase domain-containing protein n=1 Tax=Deinococcus carri TaxID=1211323 RepID=A0ABP9W650_9DEIO